VEYVHSLRRGDRLDRINERRRVLVDSDIPIEVSRGRDAGIVSRWVELNNADAVQYSPVSAAELWAGARPAEHDAPINLFRALTCAPIGQEAGGAVENAELRTRDRRHYPIKEISFFD
jgi:hypothetical protein